MFELCYILEHTDGADAGGEEGLLQTFVAVAVGAAGEGGVVLVGGRSDRRTAAP